MSEKLSLKGNMKGGHKFLRLLLIATLTREGLKSEKIAGINKNFRYHSIFTKKRRL